MITTPKVSSTIRYPFHKANLISLDIGINDPTGNPKALAPTESIDLITLAREDVLESISVTATNGVAPGTFSIGLKTYDDQSRSGTQILAKYFADLAPADPPFDAKYDRSVKAPFDIAKLDPAILALTNGEMDGLLHNKTVGSVIAFLTNSTVITDPIKEQLKLRERLLNEVTLTLKCSAIIPTTFRAYFNIKYKRASC